MKKCISILSIIILSVFSNIETFGAVGNYSVVLEQTKSEKSVVQKVKRRSLFKPRKKWKDHADKHGYRLPLVVILSLTGIFTTLKLTQVIAWSWLWVLSPIWITIVLLILIIIYVIVLFLFMPKPPQGVPISPSE
jgi:hypothetical protein